MVDSATGRAERRVFPRVPLDAPFFATVHRQEAEMRVLIVDCGRGGMQFALPPGKSLVEDWLGCAVHVRGLPDNLDPAAEGISATLSWMGGGRCGIRFNEPLPLSCSEIFELAQEL